jgi:hypothetical protein
MENPLQSTYSIAGFYHFRRRKLPRLLSTILKVCYYHNPVEYNININYCAGRSFGIMASEDRNYDAVVLGSGPSGRTVSLRLAKNSFSVALVENELVGGDCAYWACIPSKALLRPPEALTEANEVDGSRQAAQGQLGVESVLTRRERFVDHWNDDNMTKTLEEGGVDIIRGQGKLDGV